MSNRREEYFKKGGISLFLETPSDCPCCGYSMTGRARENPCPECGLSLAPDSPVVRVDAARGDMALIWIYALGAFVFASVAYGFGLRPFYVIAFSLALNGAIFAKTSGRRAWRYYFTPEELIRERNGKAKVIFEFSDFHAIRWMWWPTGGRIVVDLKGLNGRDKTVMHFRYTKFAKRFSEVIAKLASDYKRRTGSHGAQMHVKVHNSTLVSPSP